MHIAQLVRRRIGAFLQIPTAGLDISDGTVKYFAFDSENTGGSGWLAAFGEFQVSFVRRKYLSVTSEECARGTHSSFSWM